MPTEESKITEEIRRVDTESSRWSQLRPGLSVLYPTDVTKIISLAHAEICELQSALEKYQISAVQVLEEIPDPILYILQALRYYGVETDNFLQQCLKSTPPTNQITIKDLKLTSKELKSKRIKRTRVEWMEKLITMIGHFCSQHSINLLRLLEIKIIYNEIRFDKEFGFQTRHLAGRDRKKAKEDELEIKLKETVLYQLLKNYLLDMTPQTASEKKEVPRPKPVVPSEEISTLSSP